MRNALPIAWLALAVLAPVAKAQDGPGSWKPELRPFVGALIPAGAQREVVGSDALVGLQLAAELQPTFHLVGSLGVVGAQTKYPIAERGVVMLQYDVGMELSLVRQLPLDWQLRPYLGLGGGARTFLYEASALQDRTCATAYGSLGSEIQLGNVGLRTELREYVYCYRAPLGSREAQTRNDTCLTAGVAYHFR